MTVELGQHVHTMNLSRNRVPVMASNIIEPCRARQCSPKRHRFVMICSIHPVGTLQPFETAWLFGRHLTFSE